MLRISKDTITGEKDRSAYILLADKMVVDTTRFMGLKKKKKTREELKLYL